MSGGRDAFTIETLTTCLLILAMMTAEAPADGRAVLERMAEAWKINRARSRDFVYTEEIARELVKKDGKRTVSSRTFEVTFIGGEPYFYLVAEQGEPLSRERAAEERRRRERVEQYRLRVPLAKRRREQERFERPRMRFEIGRLKSTHMAKVAGSEVLAGRKAVVLRIEPKGRLRRPSNGREWTRIQSGRIWVDEATGHPMKAELEQLMGYGGHAAGSKCSFEWTRVDGVWLSSRILCREPGAERMLVRQVYSDYKRFRAESKVEFRDIP